MSLPSLPEVEAAIGQLPALPTIILEVLRVIDSGEAEMLALDRLISNDQGLASRILRIANSPFYGMSSHIDTIKDACVLLGVHTLRHLTLACGVISRFPPGKEGGFDRLQLWRHAVGVGIAARVLAERCHVDADQAFTAGLLHDIGKLALDTCFPAQYAQVLSHRDSADCSLRAAELAVLGFDHSEVGVQLGKRWHLPDNICAAIGGHHNPDRDAPMALVDLVHIADLVCRGLEIGDGGDSVMPPLSEPALGRLGLSWEMLGAAFPEIERMNAASNLLD